MIQQIMMGMGAFSPVSLSLDLWFSGDVGTYKSADTSVPAVATGDQLRFWTNRTGSGNNLSQGTSSKRGTILNPGQNGLTTIAWDGTDDFMTLTTPLTSVTAVSAFFVIKQSGDNILLGHTGGATPQFRVGATANKLNYNDSVANVTSSTLSPVQNNWSIYAFVSDGATMTFYQDGVSRGSGAASNPVTISELSGVLNGINAINGNLAEFMLATRAFSGTEITNTFAYGKGRWATP